MVNIYIDANIPPGQYILRDNDLIIPPSMREAVRYASNGEVSLTLPASPAPGGCPPEELEHLQCIERSFNVRTIEVPGVNTPEEAQREEIVRHARRLAAQIEEDIQRESLPQTAEMVRVSSEGTLRHLGAVESWPRAPHTVVGSEANRILESYTFPQPGREEPEQEISRRRMSQLQEGSELERLRKENAQLREELKEARAPIIPQMSSKRVLEI